jgi:NhaC family Na+:H+ antiporter
MLRGFQMKIRIPTFSRSLLMVGSSFTIIIIGTLIYKLRSEVLLFIAATIMTIGALRLGYTWQELEEAISQRIGKTTGVLLLLWGVGMVIGTFMFSGSIPMIIYYGIKLIKPSFLILSAFVTCLIFSVITGSSWSSAGTIGIAFAGMAQTLGVPKSITIGAVLAGSIFGDKMSPLSETTNLASLCSEANIYDHIKSMLWTTVPPSIIAGVVYFATGIGLGTTNNILPLSTLEMLTSLDNIFKWNILLLLPLIIILYGSFTKKPAVPTLFISSLSAIIIGVIFQGFSLRDGFISAVSGFNINMVYNDNIVPEITKILNRGGMTSMVSVVLIVFCGYTFAAITSKAGYLDIVLDPMLNRIKTQAHLILATLFTMLLMMFATGSAYIGFILVPEMYRKKYIEFKVAPNVLSRSLEDIGTVTGALIPWGISAAFYTTTFGIPVFGPEGYAVWTILPYLIPIFAIIYAFTGIGVYKLTDD